MTPWTEDRIERLRILWDEGWSCSEIAAELGEVSRNSVISKVRRMGLPFRKGPLASKQPKITHLPKEVRARRVKVRRIGEEPRVSAIPTLRVSFDDLRPNQCRWPEGHPKSPSFSFCGHPVELGRSYCPHHVDASRIKATKKEADRIFDRVALACLGGNTHLSKVVVMEP